MSYKNYTVKDFLRDDRFLEWVVNPNGDIASFWEIWMRDNPDKMPEVLKAREIILMINFRGHQANSTDQSDTWERIEETIRKEELPLACQVAEDRLVQLPDNHRYKENGFSEWRKYAAVFAGFIAIAGILFFLYYRMPVTYKTNYGEVQTIVLPDNSVVRLNANSRLHHKRSWNGTASREVWLEGEAFFSVVHKSSNQQFFVYTDDVTVNVTGTEFNVNNRRISTKVVLNNGSVNLLLHDSEAPKEESSPAARLSMEPGQMVEFSSETQELNVSNVDPELYSSWRTNVLAFHDAPLEEVAQSLQDNFGLDIRFEGKGIKNETFTGTIPMDNTAIFFKTISRSLNVQIIRKDAIIYIVGKEPHDNLNLN